MLFWHVIILLVFVWALCHSQLFDARPMTPSKWRNLGELGIQNADFIYLFIFSAQGPLLLLPAGN